LITGVVVRSSFLASASARRSAALVVPFVSLALAVGVMGSAPASGAPAAPAGVPAAASADAPSDLVGVPVPAPGPSAGQDDRDAARVQAAPDPIVEWPAATEATVSVPGDGEPGEDVAGSPITVAATDDALLDELDARGIVIADAAAEPAVPAGTVVEVPASPEPAGSGTSAPSLLRLARSATDAETAPAGAADDGTPDAPPGVGTDATATGPVPAGPDAVTVEVLDRAAADDLGVAGVVFVVRRADDGAASGPVTVSFDASAFAAAFGADYARRLRVIRFPECALGADPAQRPECFQTSMLPSQTTADGVVTAVLPAAADPGTLAQGAEPSTDPSPTATASPSATPEPTASGSATDPAPSMSAASPAGWRAAAAAVTTPGATATATPSPGASDTASSGTGAGTLVSEGSFGSASSGVFAVTAMAASTSGAGGTFAATPLSSAGDWSHGGNSGSFNGSVRNFV